MSQRIIIIVIGVVVLAILALFMFNVPGNQSVSPDILYITQPVNAFSGKVEKINGNTIFVSSQYSLQTASVMVKVVPGQPLVMPTPQTKTITYKLLITDKTQINQPAISVNYLLKTVTPVPPPKLTIKDIKVGQMITASSTIDLRTLKSNEFEATMINLPQITNTLNGKVVSVTNNALTLMAFAPITGSPMGAVNTVPPAPQEREYRIAVNQDTEISRMSYNAATTPEESPTPPKPEKLTIGDLRKDMQVTVYTAQDLIESPMLTALRIEPAQEIPTVTPTPVAESNVSISPTLSPTPPDVSISPSIKP